MNDSKPYDDKATEEQIKIIKDFFKGYQLKGLAEKLRKDHHGLKLKDAYHTVGLALMHISWK